MSREKSLQLEKQNSLGWKHRVAAGALAFVALTSCSSGEETTQTPNNSSSVSIQSKSPTQNEWFTGPDSTDKTLSRITCDSLTATRIDEDSYKVTVTASASNGAELTGASFSNEGSPLSHSAGNGTENSIIFNLPDSKQAYHIGARVEGDGIPLPSINKGPINLYDICPTITVGNVATLS